MAQSKLKDFASIMGKGGGGGSIGTGAKALAVVAALGYGLTQSFYTGIEISMRFFASSNFLSDHL